MDYPKASITADIIVFDPRDETFLTVIRKREPDQGKPALPGGFFDPINDIGVIYAATKELREETNITVNPSKLRFEGFYDAKDRDPRDRVVTFVYSIMINKTNFIIKSNDTEETDKYQWIPFSICLGSLVYKTLAFDHGKIISDYYWKHVHNKLKIEKIKK